jgi:hypothetical protein
MLDLTKNRYSSQWRAENAFSREKQFKIIGDDSEFERLVSKHKDIQLSQLSTPGTVAKTESEARQGIKDVISALEESQQKVKSTEGWFGESDNDTPKHLREKYYDLQKAKQIAKSWKVEPVFGS